MVVIVWDEAEDRPTSPKLKNCFSRIGPELWTDQWTCYETLAELCMNRRLELYPILSLEYASNMHKGIIGRASEMKFGLQNRSGIWLMSQENAIVLECFSNLMGLRIKRAPPRLRSRLSLIFTLALPTFSKRRWYGDNACMQPSPPPSRRRRRRRRGGWHWTCGLSPSRSPKSSIVLAYESTAYARQCKHSRAVGPHVKQLKLIEALPPFSGTWDFSEKEHRINWREAKRTAD